MGKNMGVPQWGPLTQDFTRLFLMYCAGTVNHVTLQSDSKGIMGPGNYRSHPRAKLSLSVSSYVTDRQDKVRIFNIKVAATS